MDLLDSVGGMDLLESVGGMDLLTNVCHGFLSPKRQMF